MAIDWTEIHKKYRGQWVAFKQDQRTVVAHGKTLRAVHQRALEAGVKKPIMSLVPKETVTFVGYEI